MGTASHVVASTVDIPVVIGVVVLLLVAVIGLLIHGMVSAGAGGTPWTEKPRRHFRG